MTKKIVKTENPEHRYMPTQLKLLSFMSLPKAVKFKNIIMYLCNTNIKTMTTGSAEKFTKSVVSSRHPNLTVLITYLSYAILY